MQAEPLRDCMACGKADPLAIEKSTKKIKRRFGDRVDGRRVRTISPMARVSPYIMKTRNTSQNYIRDEIDTTKIDQYIKEKKAKEHRQQCINHKPCSCDHYCRCFDRYFCVG